MASVLCIASRERHLLGLKRGEHGSSHRAARSLSRKALTAPPLSGDFLSFAYPRSGKFTIRITKKMELSEKLCDGGQDQSSLEGQTSNSRPITNRECSPLEPNNIFNRIIYGSSENMSEIPDQSVHLTITSPPYNVNKEYEREQSFEDWLGLMRRVFTEVKRVTIPGGRVCVNVTGTGRSPYIPLQFYTTGILLDLGFLMRGEIIWSKGASVGRSSAWGSWKSATNPCLRDTHEFVLIFCRDKMKRDPIGADTTISRDDFLRCTQSLWEIPTESAKRIGHPSPFPVELPRRLIELYSFADDVVLDPFCGSGTTCVAAVLTGRRYIGYDIIPEYCEVARQRISQTERSLQAIEVAG